MLLLVARLDRVDTVSPSLVSWIWETPIRRLRHSPVRHAAQWCTKPVGMRLRPDALPPPVVVLVLLPLLLFVLPSSTNSYELEDENVVLSEGTSAFPAPVVWRC